jgi:hypothetical protein
MIECLRPVSFSEHKELLVESPNKHPADHSVLPVFLVNGENHAEEFLSGFCNELKITHPNTQILVYNSEEEKKVLVSQYLIENPFPVFVMIAEDKYQLLDTNGFYIYTLQKEGWVSNIIYAWNYIKCYNKCNIGTNGSVNWYYEFETDKIQRDWYSFETIVKEITKNHYLGGSRFSLNKMLTDFLDRSSDLSSKYSEILGFDKQGWVLPGLSDKICIPLTAESKNIVSSLKEVLSKELHCSSKYLEKLYEITSIDHKDIIFSWYMASPFMYGLKEYTDLEPSLAMYGQNSGGKSAIAKLFTKLYGFKKKSEVYSASNLKTNFQFTTVLCSSTFPVSVDDCADLNQDHLGDLKAHITSYCRVKKGGRGEGGQGYSVDSLLQSPIAMGYNLKPEYFKDEAWRTRIIQVPVGQIEDNPEWSKLKNQLPNGCLLWAVYRITKDMTSRDLYEKMIDLTKEAKGRDQKIMQILELGSWLWNEIVGYTQIELDYEILEKLISDTKNSGYIEAVNSTLDYISKRQTIQTYTEYKNKQYYVIDTETIREIQSITESNSSKRWSYEKFVDLVKFHFPDIEFKTHPFFYPMVNINGKFERQKQQRGVLIPTTYFESEIICDGGVLL